MHRFGQDFLISSSGSTWPDLFFPSPLDFGSSSYRNGKDSFRTTTFDSPSIVRRGYGSAACHQINLRNHRSEPNLGRPTLAVVRVEDESSAICVLAIWASFNRKSEEVRRRRIGEVFGSRTILASITMHAIWTAVGRQLLDWCRSIIRTSRRAMGDAVVSSRYVIGFGT